MKSIYLTLLLLFTAVPSLLMAIPVTDAAVIANTGTIIGTTGATAASSALTAANLFYLNYQMDSLIGEGYAVVPEYAPTNAALTAKLLHKVEAQQESDKQLRNSLVQKATVENITPSALWEKMKSIRAGDVTKVVRDKLEDTWTKIQDTISNTLSEEALNAAMANFVSDILSCQTPQLVTAFPSIDLDLDLGIKICDYNQMFNDMKDNVDKVRKQGSFKVNGKNLSEVMKDPKLLGVGLQQVSPTQGHALVADFFSNLSEKAAITANLDTTALGAAMAQDLKKSGFKKMFKDRTILDALDDATNIEVRHAQIDLANGQAANQIAAAQVRVQSESVNLAAEQREDYITQRHANRLNNATSGW